MASLKAFLPTLGKIFGISPDALYSRQRALTALGLLEYVPGRGPGSGVPLSAESVAALVIALMAADSLQGTDARVVVLCEAVPTGGDYHKIMNPICPLTNATSFKSAVAHLLVSPQLLDANFAWIYVL